MVWANIGAALGHLKRYREAVGACGTAVELGTALGEWQLVGMSEAAANARELAGGA